MHYMHGQHVASSSHTETVLAQDLLADAAVVDALYLSIMDRAHAEPFRFGYEHLNNAARQLSSFDDAMVTNLKALVISTCLWLRLQSYSGGEMHGAGQEVSAKVGLHSCKHGLPNA